MGVERSPGRETDRDPGRGEHLPAVSISEEFPSWVIFVLRGKAKEETPFYRLRIESQKLYAQHRRVDLGLVCGPGGHKWSLFAVR